MTASHNRTVSVIGLGYVGLPVAVAFGQQSFSVGFDINAQRIAELKDGLDHTLEVSSDALRSANVLFTDDATDLQKADFHIIGVPTPINDSKQPDLTPLIKASETLGPQLKKGDIVVYESTVYPGTTEEDCVPVLERTSGLTCGVDFFVGYSPERINPGDKERTFTNILKIVSGQTPEVLDIVAAVYESVVKPGVHRAGSIKVAEAAKVIENTQRDLNIALMNELAIIFNHMEIDTIEVLEAAGTKWNFLPFRPGLVGGHCIGVDPYYLTHKAEKLGYHPDVILAGRRINDGMGEYLAGQIVKQMIAADQPVKGARLAIQGITFKEDCPDIRNSKVIDVIRGLQSWGIDVLVQDPQANSQETEHEYGIRLVDASELTELDGIVVCVAHRQYRETSAADYKALLKPGAGVYDVKAILDRDAFRQQNVPLWRL
ncbi:nucleotide sugar dehydrogenase [Reinekea blandensis]|uniref:UDP-glucose/GDP-mannose dehydrogenase family protein n=1 Tax=Reinekea blandensis MED297 TaxID=314283 RepID=A4B975_9GAMM|nr:nucleotide sugar dehydrogenase [Reinekea blandensis]EAR11176.1 UDP-glucose/GDP-mannose dehydrogenase family protein [Reinekea sp. MED297] [Reinekea blandensis MED297]